MKTMRPTKRQWQILGFIDEYADEHGWSPSIREIMAATGLRSTSSVQYQLKELERLGCLRRQADRPRAIAILPMASSSKYEICDSCGGAGQIAVTS